MAVHPVASPSRSTRRTGRQWFRFARAGRILSRERASIRVWLGTHARYLAGVGALTLLAGLPLLQLKLMMGHDSAAYVPRAVQFAEVLKSGEVLPRWAPAFGAGHGEPTFNFHPPLPQYLTVFFHEVGFSFIGAENIVALLLLMLAGLGMYVLASEAFGPRGGLVAAAAYVFAPYLQSRLYVSHALADYSAFAFVPLAFWGLGGAVRGSWPRWLVALFGAVGILLTSIPVTIIVFPALGLYVLLLSARTRTVAGLFRGGWALGLSLMTTMAFWLPAATETGYVHIARREERIDYHDQFLALRQLLHSDWGYGLSVAGTGDGMSFAIGAAHLVGLVLALVLLRWIWRRSPDAGVLVALCAAYSLFSVFMMTSASVIIWEHVDQLPPFQFPWRYLSFIAFASSLACGAVFSVIRPEWRTAANWLMIGIVGAILAFNFQHAKPQGFLAATDDDYSSSTIAAKGLATTAREFEPIDVVDFPPPAAAPLIATSGNAVIEPTHVRPTEHTFRVNAQGDAWLRSATFYFPGWTLFIDGTRATIYHANPNGLIEFPVPPGEHDIRLVFRDTAVRGWSERASLVGLVLIPLTLACAWRARRRELSGAGAGSLPSDAIPTEGLLPVLAMPPKALRVGARIDPVWQRIVRTLRPGDDPVDSALEADRRRWWSKPLPRTREGVIAWAFVVGAAAFQAFYLRTEITTRIVMVNDGALHQTLLDRTLAALRSGKDPTDFWFAPVTAGYPAFHHYQHLPFLLPALVAWVLPVSVPTLYQWTVYLLLLSFPFSVYWSMRRFGFSPIAAGMGALVSPVIATDGLFGFDSVSYAWRGFGLYTQLWAMVLLPPALAQGYRTLREGTGYFWTVLLVAAVLLSHLVLGYIALGTLVIFALLRPTPTEVWRRGRRLGIVLLLVGVVTSYFISGVVADNAYFARSVYEEPSRYDGLGAQSTLSALFHGRLFDDLRFGWLTMIVFAGALVSALRWREERYRIPAMIALVWLTMYFGPKTLGVLANAATLNVNFYVHRLIAGIHLGGIMLMGIALAVPWRWALTRRRALYLVVPAAITALVLVPVYNERREYLQLNVDLMEYNGGAFAAEQPLIDAVEEELHAAPPGRVYAGLPARWGKDYRVASVPVSHVLFQDGFDMIGYFYYPFSLNADIIGSLDEGRAEHYNLFNIRYVVAPPEQHFNPEIVKPYADFGKFKIYQVETSGYFDLVSSDVTFEGDKDEHFAAALWWLESTLPEAKEHPAILFNGGETHGKGPYPLASAPTILGNMTFDAGAPRGEVLSERVGMNSYVADVHVSRTSMLMLKETFHPGWHVTIDGREADTVMLMPSYIGVELTPGPHHASFEYRPPRSRFPLLLLGVLALPALAAGEWGRSRVGRSSD